MIFGRKRKEEDDVKDNMTITQKLQNIFPGISTLVTGFARSFRAGRVYALEMRAIKTLCSEVPINKWMLKINKHSPLSYYDAYRIITFLAEESEEFKRNPDKVTKYVIELASEGHHVDGILLFLQQGGIVLSRRGYNRGSLAQREELSRAIHAEDVGASPAGAVNKGEKE